MSDSLHKVMLLAERCAFSRRMPIQAQRLAQAASLLSEPERVRLCAYMKELDAPVRMARRACQAAPSNLLGPKRIISAMESLLGKEATIEALREVEYERRLVAHAMRISSGKKNQLLKAVELLGHIRDLFGPNLEIDEQLDVIRNKTAAQRQALRPAFVAPCI